MSSRARHQADSVVDHVPVDDVGQPALEAAHRLHRGLAGGLLAVVVGPTLGRVAQLDGRHDVQRPVDLAVTRPREPVANLVTGGRVERGEAVPRREVSFGGEPGDVTDVDQQPGRAGRADAVQRQQRRDVEERPYVVWNQSRRTLHQPADQLAGGEDDDLLGSLSDGQAHGIHHGDHGGRVDAEAARSAE